MEKSKRNILHYPLVIGFLLVLTLPMFNSAVGIWKFDRVAENRTFTDSLSIKVDHLDLFPEDAEAYMNDNFSFRKPLLDLFHGIKFYVFNTSPHPDKLIVGKNGWYFMGQEELANYQGKHNFDADTLKLFLEEWKRRINYLDQKGIKTYWMIAPTAHPVYSEHLPFNIRPGSERRVTQLKNYFKNELPDLIIDPLSELIENKKRGQLYYRQDNHWTFRAGEIAHEVFVKNVRRDFPNYTIPLPQQVKWRNELVFNGIHRTVLGIKTMGEIRELPVFAHALSHETNKYDFPITPGFHYGWDYEHRYLNESIKKGLKIVIIRDSFGEHIIPFLSESFCESVYIFDAWQYKLNEHIIDTVKPDIVLFLMVETHLESIVKVL